MFGPKLWIDVFILATSLAQNTQTDSSFSVVNRLVLYESFTAPTVTAGCYHPFCSVEGTGKLGSAKLGLLFLDFAKAGILLIAEALMLDSASVSLTLGVTKNNKNPAASLLTGSDINPARLGLFNHLFKSLLFALWRHTLKFQSSLRIPEDLPLTNIYLALR